MTTPSGTTSAGSVDPNLIEGRERLRRARRVVVKLGSRLIDSTTGQGDAGQADVVVERAAEIAALRAEGREVVVVSSGAIALGIGPLGFREKPRPIPLKQAAAAIGQSRLMQRWEAAFSPHRVTVAQLLLTHDDMASRLRYLNARHCLLALLEHGMVPVINENDTVSVDEIKFGDNDRLSALVTSLVAADALVILTDVAGLYDRDPSDPLARLIPVVTDIDAQAAPVAAGAGSAVSTGGMRSKVEAARVAGRFGVPTVVAAGRAPGVLTELLSGAPVGTLFVPRSPLSGRKHWIAYTLNPRGTLVVDAGAREAIVDRKRSLLPSGVREVRGRFEQGEAVAIAMAPAGEGSPVEFARGLSGYSSEDIDRIKGKRTADIETLLGYRYLDEVVHRDDLVVL
jgi:glutamate 5-kinase